MCRGRLAWEGGKPGYSDLVGVVICEGLEGSNPSPGVLLLRLDNFTICTKINIYNRTGHILQKFLIIHGVVNTISLIFDLQHTCPK